VDGAQVPVGVLLTNEFRVMLPVLQRLLHKVIFVGEAPPHIAIGGETRENVFPVQVIGLPVHDGEAPPVIGVHDDQVRLDPQLHQVPYASFYMAEMRRIGPREIPAVFRVLRLKGHEVLPGHPFVGTGRPFKGECRGVPEVVVIVFGEYAEADLVEVPLRKSFQCLPLYFLRLVRPHIAGRTDRIIGCTVLVGEMVRIGHADRPMVAFPRGRHGKNARKDFIKEITPDPILVFPDKGRHKAHAIDAVPVVEPVHGFFLVRPGETGPQAVVRKGVPSVLSPKRQLIDTPALGGGGLL